MLKAIHDLFFFFVVVVVKCYLAKVVGHFKGGKQIGGGEGLVARAPPTEISGSPDPDR